MALLEDIGWERPQSGNEHINATGLEKCTRNNIDGLFRTPMIGDA